MKKYLLYAHPFLFTFVSLMLVYAGARLIAPPYEMLRLLLVLWLTLLVLYPLAYKIAGNWDVAGIFLTIVVFGFYFQERSFVAVGTLTGLIVVAVFIFLLMTKRRFQVSQVSLVLTLIGLGTAMAISISLFILFLNIPISYYEVMGIRSKPISRQVTGLAAGDKPDIYYIVLDGYPRADVLKEMYGYDNSAFINDLNALSFFVPEESLSNYPRTALSISTTLDMQYWDSISPHMQDAVFWWLVIPVMDHSRARTFLESRGYQSISIATDWGITDNPTADLYLKPYPIILNDYENYFLSSVPLKFLYAPFQSVAPITTNDLHRQYILFNLEMLKEIPDIQGSKFVFSHIIVPHPPFVFESDGSPIESDTGFTFDSPDGSLFTKEEYRHNYIGQIEFINNQIKQVIGTILRKSKIPPIIILQADHGSAMYVDFNSPETSCMKERFAVFGAYYLPGKGRGVMPQNVTPVNLFRIIFNEYFGAQMNLLENHQYFMNGFSLFDVQDVTRQVNEDCVIPQQP
jgi:hypothetical protein